MTRSRLARLWIVDGVMRGKYMSKSKFLSAAKGGFGFVSVVPCAWVKSGRTDGRTEEGLGVMTREEPTE